jgi:hypothetical protein
MQPNASIGAQADDVAGVGRDFWLVEDEVEHGRCFFQINSLQCNHDKSP